MWSFSAGILPAAIVFCHDTPIAGDLQVQAGGD